MPCLTIFTNLVKKEIPKDFVNKIVPVLAASIDKPPERFVVVISGDAAVSFNGNSEEPGAVATLASIGHLEPWRNKVITEKVTDFVRKELGIAPERFSIFYNDVQATHVARNGKLLSDNI